MALGAIGLRTKLLYGFGTVAYGIKDNGFNFLLLIFYNQLLGLPAQLVGLAPGLSAVALGARFCGCGIGTGADHYQAAG